MHRPRRRQTVDNLLFNKGNHRFPGQYFDAEIGLHYNYFRDYDPRRGRYIEADPIGLRGGKNLYIYVENLPTRLIDYRGLLSYDEAFAHYKEGTGNPIRIGFSEVDTLSVKPSDFPGFNKTLPSSSKKTITVNVDEKMAYSTKGNMSLILGNITLRLLGKIESTRCEWKFNGVLKSYDDLYDFNPANRGVIGEVFTWFGRQSEGQPYWIEIRGEKQISEEGVW